MTRTSSANPLPLTCHAIKTRLRALISRRWKAGDRLPTIDELARTLRAGRVNTHRAVKELASEGVLCSRPRLGTFVTETALAGLPPSLTLPSLKGKTVTILPPRIDSFFQGAVDILRAQLDEREATVRLDTFNVVNFQQVINQHRDSDAVVLVNALIVPDLHFRSGQVVTWINTAIGNPLQLSKGYDMVTVDSEVGAVEVGRHLRELGGDSVCFLGCQPVAGEEGYDATSTVRLRGLEAGFGGKVDPRHRLIASRYQMDIGALACKDYLELPDRPRCVFAASDDLAIGFIHGAIAHGMEVGRDVMVVGFDGQERGRNLVCGPLTTIDTPVLDIGHEAARLLIDRMTAPDRPVRRIQLGGTLFKGDTTRPLT